MLQEMLEPPLQELKMEIHLPVPDQQYKNQSPNSALEKLLCDAIKRIVL